jgi:glutaminase
MAATIANNGINPKTNKQIIDKKYITYNLGQMVGGGLYEYSDKWMIDIGIPAKSGVSGVIMAVVPGIMGIGVVSPPLDSYGNSVKGIKTVEYLSKKLNLNILHSPIYCK